MSKARMIICCSIVLLAVFITGGFVQVFAQAESVSTTYYVATNGDNGDLGTLAKPWLTIQFAVDQTQPGDTIIVRGGVYTETVGLSTSGTEGLPITLTPYRSESVMIDGDAEPALHAKWNGTEWWIIDGLILKSNHQYVIQFGVWYSFWSDHMVVRNNLILGSIIVNGNHNVFEGNEVDGTNHTENTQGVSEETENSHHNVYRNNHIHHFTHRCFWSMRFTHNSVFEHNEIHDCDNMGLDLDGYGSAVWGHIVQGNEIYNVGEYGLEIENAFSTSVISNTIHDVSERGIAIINYGDGHCSVSPDGLYGDLDGDGDCRDELTGNIVSGNVIQGGLDHGAIIDWSTGGVLFANNIIDCFSSWCAGILLDCNGFCNQIELRNNSITQCLWGDVQIKDFTPLLNMTIDESAE